PRPTWNCTSVSTRSRPIPPSGSVRIPTTPASPCSPCSPCSRPRRPLRRSSWRRRRRTSPPRHKIGPMPIDVANSDLLLSTTRSVRKRLDFERPVEREVLLECLQLAVQAPTASNRQTWRWMVVTDADLRLKVADYYREAALPYLGESLAAAEGEGGQARRVFDSAMYLAENMEKAPAFVIPCLDEDL